MFARAMRNRSCITDYRSSPKLFSRLCFPKTGFYVLGIACLAAFLKFWEPGLRGGSSSTYGALALSMVKSGHWFHPALGAQLFDPFVDHPYLVLWEEALLFSIFGASAFAVRLASSISGIVIVVLLFAVVRKRFDELTAFFTVVSLMTIGQFMLFVSSGWLDIPMIAWVLWRAIGPWSPESFFSAACSWALPCWRRGRAHWPCFRSWRGWCSSTSAPSASGWRHWPAWWCRYAPSRPRTT